MIKKKITFIVIAIIIVFGGLAIAYGVMHAGIKKDQVANSESPANVNDGLLGFVDDFYKEYETQVGADGSRAESHQTALMKYGTDNAVANFGSQEKTCFQNVPASVTADDVASLNNPFTVNVTYNFTEDPTTAVVTVLNQGGTLKIDAISC